MAQPRDAGLTTKNDFGKFNIDSYNLHGLNSGQCLLYDLCNDPSNFIIAVQEHWFLYSNNNLLLFMCFE
jgi:hypothetical protein